MKALRIICLANALYLLPIFSGMSQSGIDFGPYEKNVKFYIECIQVHIPSNNEWFIKYGETYDKDLGEYLKISSNFKKLTKDDYRKIALHKHFYLAFDMLVSIAKGAGKHNKENTAFTDNALKAQNALTYLSPEGKTWGDFYEIIGWVDSATNIIRDGYRKRDAKKYQN